MLRVSSVIWFYIAIIILKLFSHGSKFFPIKTAIRFADFNILEIYSEFELWSINSSVRSSCECLLDHVSFLKCSWPPDCVPKEKNFCVYCMLNVSDASYFCCCWPFSMVWTMRWCNDSYAQYTFLLVGYSWRDSSLNLSCHIWEV